MSIRIGIYGYGNLGRGVEAAIRQNDDMELVAVFTRRPPETLTINTPGAAVLSADKAAEMSDKIDVMIICGGSATDGDPALQGFDFEKDLSPAFRADRPLLQYLSGLLPRGGI